MKIIIILCSLIFFFQANYAVDETDKKVTEIISNNISASRLKENMNRVKYFSFQTGSTTYTANSDGSLKVCFSLQNPAVYEVILIEDKKVRKNSLNTITHLKGIEQRRWICLAKLFSGLFTLKNFPGPWLYIGVKTYGREQFHVLAASVAGLQAFVYIDSNDFLVKQLVLNAKDSQGRPWKQSCVFGDYIKFEGIYLPQVIYFSRIGVKGAGAPRSQTASHFRINPELPGDFFTTMDINIGKKSVKSGQINGQVIGAFFYDDFFTLIFTNWNLDDLRSGGFKSGDHVIISSGDLNFVAWYYEIEDHVDNPEVYKPPNAMFTHNPVRRPLFYIQFNQLSPQKRFQNFKRRIKLFSPIQAKKR